MTFELFLLSLSFGFAIGLLVWMLINSFKEVQEEAEEAFEVYSTSPFFKICLPFIQYVGRRLEGIRSLDFFRRKVSK